MLDLSIIIIHYNTRELTLNCLKSIYDYPPKKKFEVTLVDNGSSDHIEDDIREQYPKVKLIRSEINLGFSKGNNLGIRSAPESISYLLLNSDTILLPGSLDNLISFSDQNQFGIISCKLLNSDKSFQPNAGELPTFLYNILWLSNIDGILGIPGYHATIKDYYKNARRVGWVAGTAMLIKNEVIKKIGYLDENIFMYGEDVEYCFRANKAGVKIGWTDEAEIIHIGGGSSKDPRYRQWLGEFKGLLYMYKKYYSFPITIFIRLMIYIFVTLRIFAFAIMGKFDYAITYGKVIVNI